MGTLNRIFDYLFINSKVNTLLFFASDYQDHLREKLLEAKTIYKKQIRRYGGLGFFLSFIRGTEAYTARENLYEIVNKGDEDIIKHLPTILEWMVNSPFHVLIRTLASIAHSSFELELSETLFRTYDAGGANRFNPFLYLAKFFVLLIDLIEPLIDLTIFNQKIPIIFRIPFVAIGLMFLSFGFIFAVLYFTTELVLNTLNTLLVEPVRFVFEVIQQLITGWNSEFKSYAPENFKKLNNFTQAVDPHPFDEAIKDNSLNIYNGSIVTLVESRKDVLLSLDKHQNHAFFQANKNTPLFNLHPHTILKAYRNHNMFQNFLFFSHFTKTSMANLFPVELTAKIVNICNDMPFPAEKKQEESNPNYLTL
ncbi:MAG: hypothetical protein H0U57_09010 [Tatlockia sp.]|nr:hypothetical protein [Tatlockia sp.]